MCDYPEFSDINEPVARKDHRCDDCGRKIEKGTKHLSWSGKVDGQVFRCRLCRQCEVLHAYMDADFGGDDGCSIGWGALCETWSEYSIDLPLEVLALSPPSWMKRRANDIEHNRKYYGYVGTAR